MQEVFDEIRSALHTVWNRRWVALGVAWVICVLGWLAIAFIPNSYESRARIYVELEDVLSEQLDISGDGKQAITKVRQTLVSGVNLERVIRTTKLGEKVVTDAVMSVPDGADCRYSLLFSARGCPTKEIPRRRCDDLLRR